MSPEPGAERAASHTTVLAAEAVAALRVLPDGTYVDGTFGRGGHSRRILEQLGPSVILNAPALFGAARGTAWTDLPRESIPSLIELFGKAADA